MAIKMQNVLKLFSYALVGGLCAFTLDFLFSIFMPKSISSSTVVAIGPGVIALLGAISGLLFLKTPKRIPIVLFFVGFIFINKLFDGIAAVILPK